MARVFCWAFAALGPSLDGCQKILWGPLRTGVIHKSDHFVFFFVWMTAAAMLAMSTGAGADPPGQESLVHQSLRRLELGVHEWVPESHGSAPTC